MANIFYQKLKCLLSVASNLLLAFVNASLLLHSFLKFAAKMHYVWQGVIVMISRQICDIKIVVNSRYVCQGTNRTKNSAQTFRSPSPSAEEVIESYEELLNSEHEEDLDVSFHPHHVLSAPSNPMGQSPIVTGMYIPYIEGP